jgi:pimeloyl-ACP methyl ester carboxylesterase
MRGDFQDDGRLISYLDVRGPGERVAGTLLFLHAFPLAAEMWEPQLAAVPAGWRFVAPDLRGFGGSSPDGVPPGRAGGEGGPAIDDYARDVLALLDQLGIREAIFCGLSMGGYVAFSLAARHPEVLKGLVIVCSKAEADTTQAKEGRQKMAQTAQSEGSKPVADTMMSKMFCENTYKNRPDLVAKLRGIMEACPPNTIANACFAMRDRVDRTPDLPNLPMPVLVVLGEKDVIIPAEMGAKMAGVCRKGEFVLIKAAGHLAPMEEPTAVNEAIAAFAGRIA